ncbi:MAG: PilN domain-containing protein [Candidatus Omnitrophica bacterium]|nr:PilN domain-containing protein [Candidatus Omnitrophota bacterium]
MSQIYINLNPRKERVESIIFHKIVSYLPFVALGVGATFIVILVMNFFVIGKMATFNRYKQQWKANEDKYNQILKIKSQAQQLSQEAKILRQVTTPATRIVKVLEDVYKVLPQNIWFKDLTFKEGSINFQGYVVAWKEDYLISLVDKFMSPLKQREYFSSKFSKVNLKHSQRKTFYGIEVLEYSMECEK